jgi:2-polyprenyl-6-methoxyphenol hydroxylase-like FAD-dependent oxidoreductase
MPQFDHAVLIVGGGPTGLMLASELALAGVDVAIIEQRPDQTLAGSRAGGLHARSIEILDQRGMAEPFLAEGQQAQAVGFAGQVLDLSAFPTRHPYTLGLWQNHIERILAGEVAKRSVTFHRGQAVTGLLQDAEDVTVTLADGRSLTARYLVGCDGGRSFVRKASGIGFPGFDATTSALLAEVEMAVEPPFGMHRSAFGIHSFGRTEYEIRDGQIVYTGGPIRLMLTEAAVGPATDPTLDDLRAALVATCGTDYGVHSPIWISRFSDTSRQAETYRSGRVFLAGDAAHIHAPDGGQGLNTGVQDAFNLGWKLAAAVHGTAPEALLDTYHTERHPVGTRVLRLTMAAVALRRPDDRTTALRETVADLLGIEATRQHLAGQLSGLSIAYDFGPGHPLLGHRVPDLDLVTAAGPSRLYAPLHPGRPLLVIFAGSIEISGWADRVETLAATTSGPWILPALGPVPAPSAILIRPDGHIAWAGQGTDEGLPEALTRWFGQQSH